jgi:hypothetical protein
MAVSPRCPVCGRGAPLELVEPAGPAHCPRCGSLFRWVRDHIGRAALRLDTPFDSLDSLDKVELILEVEERLTSACRPRIWNRSARSRTCCG